MIHLIKKKVFHPIKAKPIENKLETIDMSKKMIEFLESDIFYYDKANNIFWDSIKAEIELSEFICPKTPLAYVDILNLVNSSGIRYRGGEKYSKQRLIDILKCFYNEKISK